MGGTGIPIESKFNLGTMSKTQVLNLGCMYGEKCCIAVCKCAIDLNYLWCKNLIYFCDFFTPLKWAEHRTQFKPRHTFSLPFYLNSGMAWKAVLFNFTEVIGSISFQVASPLTHSSSAHFRNWVPPSLRPHRGMPIMCTNGGSLIRASGCKSDTFKLWVAGRVMFLCSFLDGY